MTPCPSPLQWHNLTANEMLACIAPAQAITLLLFGEAAPDHCQGGPAPLQSRHRWAAPRE